MTVHILYWKWKRRSGSTLPERIHEKRFFIREIMSAKHTHTDQSSSQSGAESGKKRVRPTNRGGGYERCLFIRIQVTETQKRGNKTGGGGGGTEDGGEGRGERAAEQEQVKSRTITGINDSISCPFRRAACVTAGGGGDRDDSNCEYVIWIGDDSGGLGRGRSRVSLLLHN